MPQALSYPGVYIDEVSSGVHTIIGVSTSIAAFVGRTEYGPTNNPIVINGYADFERRFGGLWAGSKLPYAVRDFFLNGGSQAIIIRLYHSDNRGKDSASLKIDVLTLEAKEPGSWGKNLRGSIDVDVPKSVADGMGLTVGDLFNLTITDGDVTETFLSLTFEDNAQRIDRVLQSGSNLVHWKGAFQKPNPPSDNLKAAHEKQADLAKAREALAKAEADKANDATIKEKQKDINDAEDALTAALAKLADAFTQAQLKLEAAQNANPPVPANITAAQTALDNAKAAQDASDGDPLQDDDFAGPGKEGSKQGLYALEKADIFNILCIPPYVADMDVGAATVAAAAQYCERRRAILLVDPPSSWVDKEHAKNNVIRVGTNSKNAAIFFPRLKQADSLQGGKIGQFVPSGVVAGIFARTDATRGVWKAPAGFDATLVGVADLTVPLSNGENGELNPLGINCLRTMPAAGLVVWGSRTLQGDDRLASDWKYIPVRRTALFIEESLYRGTQWVVFEPNDEPLWAQIRLNVGAFMNNLFRQGAFQGQTPRDAYFVKCDKTTTTQNDIDLGVVNILVGFAPLKPAEFVVIKIQQIAGQIQT